MVSDRDEPIALSVFRYNYILKVIKDYVKHLTTITSPTTGLKWYIHCFFVFFEKSKISFLKFVFSYLTTYTQKTLHFKYNTRAWH